MPLKTLYLRLTTHHSQSLAARIKSEEPHNNTWIPILRIAENNV